MKLPVVEIEQRYFPREDMCYEVYPEDFGWVCSLAGHYRGDHAAHPGHNLATKPRQTWPNPDPTIYEDPL